MEHITKTKGFTLLEMIIVIVVLGVLSITAAPRLMSTSSDAKIASLEGFIGAFRTAESIVEGKLAMEDKSMKSQQVVSTEDGIEAQFGSIVLSYENLTRAMDVDGYRIATCKNHQQMFIVPSTYKQVPTGGDSISDCVKALYTQCYVSLYDTQLPGGQDDEKEFALSTKFAGC